MATIPINVPDDVLNAICEFYRYEEQRCDPDESKPDFLKRRYLVHQIVTMYQCATKDTITDAYDW